MPTQRREDVENAEVFFWGYGVISTAGRNPHLRLFVCICGKHFIIIGRFAYEIAALLSLLAMTVKYFVSLH